MLGWRMSLNRLHIRRIFIAATAILLGCVPALVAEMDTKIEFHTSGGFTGNLLFDSNSVNDAYSAASANIKFYPYSNLEVSLENEYTYYGKIFGLSNFNGGVGLTFIPTDNDSRLSLYFNGRFNSRLYRMDYSGFNSDIFEISTAVGYLIAPAFQMRSGFMFKSERYPGGHTHEEDEEEEQFPTFDISPDNEVYEFFLGGNLALFGHVALDIEGGYERLNLTYVNPPTDSMFAFWEDPPSRILRNYLNPNKDSLIDGTLDAYYISPRISFHIKDKIGVNVIYIYRAFSDPDNIIIPGLSIKFLSPWASVYEDDAIAINLKTYLVPGMIVTAGAGYWDKDFLTSEQERPASDGLAGPTTIINDRKDETSKFYLGVQKPFTFRSGLFLEPTLYMEYISNRSSYDFYDYSAFSAAFGLIFRL